MALSNVVSLYWIHHALKNVVFFNLVLNGFIKYFDGNSYAVPN